MPTSDPPIITTGRYRHFKGREYTVLGIARHSETLDPHVLYRQEYGDHSLWIRPLEMFMEQVEVDGQIQPRFELIQPQEFDGLVSK
ncbi:MAG: DUF1653 domain-containing protein [Planctomycetaceae bacterium]|nr:DUF1653 domain-containing protein [Planctomycetaceae bacterium]